MSKLYNTKPIEGIKKYFLGIMITNDDYSDPIFQEIYGLKPEVSCVKPTRIAMLELFNSSNFNPELKDAELY